MHKFHFSSVNSTNDYARELLSDHGIVMVTADMQTQGRGRMGRKWNGEFGANVYCSFGIHHPQGISANEAAMYQAFGCLSALNALRDIAPSVEFRLKYPNDILAIQHGQRRKICGVLIENEFIGNRSTSTVIGIGINVAQTTFDPILAETATSLALLGIQTSRDSVLEALEYSAMQLLPFGTTAWRQTWRENLAVEGRSVQIKNEADVWSVNSMLDDGRLLLSKPDGSTRIHSDGDSLIYE